MHAAAPRRSLPGSARTGAGAAQRAAGAVALALFVLLAAGARADTRYVGEQFRLGLHERAAIDSTIVELVPIGTALEVLAREGELVRVRTTEGVEGWVDARYLSETPPGSEALQALETELAGAQAALADAQARIVALEQAGAPAPATVEDPAGEAISSDALREMQSLAEENQRLKQQVAELEAVQRMAVEAPAAPEAPDAPASVNPQGNAPTFLAGMLAPDGWNPWHLLLLASVLLLAFAVGGWLVDWDVRRRHGGFRV